MYRLSSNFGFQDVYDLLNVSKDIILGKHILEENIPKDVVFQFMLKDLKELISRDILKLALIDENEVVNGLMLVEKSNWDSDHFGTAVGKLRLAIFNRKVQVSDRRHLIRRIKDLAASKRINVIFARVPLDDLPTIRSIELEGGFLTDILLTFYINLRRRFDFVKVKSNAKITHASEKDRKALMEMAKNTFKIDHFHADPNLPNNECDELYAKWIANCIDGSADVILVAKKGNGVVGFITCKIQHVIGDYNYGVIDLIGVNEEYRGKGIGCLLISEALKWFSRYTDSVYVGTQARNIPAVRLYEKMGFRQVFSEATLHLWVSIR